MAPDEKDDLRSDIMTAFESDGATPADGSPPEPPPAPDPSQAHEPAPGDEPARARDAYGRFVRQEADLATQQAQAPLSQPGQAQAAATQQHVARTGPPPGWSPTAKSLFEKLPDPVKAAVAQREVEVSQGLAKLAEYRGIDPYVEMARNSGTTLPEALNRYVNAENALEADPVNGILWFCQRYNVHPAQLMEAIGGGQGDQNPDPSVHQVDPRLAGHFQAFDQRLASIEQERENAENYAVSSQIHGFAQDPANRYFENVRHQMAHIIRTAPQNVPLTLKQVYEEACWANPEIRELLISERSNGRQNGVARRADQIRRGAGSLPPGSPVGGNPPVDGPDPQASLREDITRAFYN